MVDVAVRSDNQLINGICVEFSGMLQDEVRQEPELAMGRWRVASQWQGQTESLSQIENSHIGGDDLKRTFSIHMDQPHELCGGNAYASPQEHLLAAVCGCFISNFVAVCTLRSISLISLDVKLSGSTDMRGLFDIVSTASSGFQEINFEVNVKSIASDDELLSVFEHVTEISPNLDCLGAAAAVRAKLNILAC